MTTQSLDRANAMRFIELPVNSQSEATEGYEINGVWHWVRLCAVESDGSVLAFDEISGHYSRIHSLTDDQQSAARSLAGV